VYARDRTGCYNEQEDIFQTICKTGTGFSDDQLNEFYQELQQHTIAVKHTGYHVHEKMVSERFFKSVLKKTKKTYNLKARFLTQRF
jgi:ATP-dependent DNA ligase